MVKIFTLGIFRGIDNTSIVMYKDLIGDKTKSLVYKPKGFFAKEQSVKNIPIELIDDETTLSNGLGLVNNFRVRIFNYDLISHCPNYNHNNTFLTARAKSDNTQTEILRYAINKLINAHKNKENMDLAIAEVEKITKGTAKIKNNLFSSYGDGLGFGLGRIGGGNVE